jgi:hypothetical protein
VSIPAGRYTFGPENGALWVRTGRIGAVATVGHDLLILVTTWRATLEVGGDGGRWSIVFEADPSSLQVREGVGGVQALGDDEKDGIRATIDEEILERREIAFRSTAVEAGSGSVSVRGALTLAGTTRPLHVDVVIDDAGTLRGRAVVRQSDWGITPYTTLFGALKVADEVEVVLDGAWRAEAAGGLGDAPWELEWKPTPLVDPGVSSFLWALLFFLYLWLGMALLGVAAGTALVTALVAGFGIFLLVRTYGVGREGH